MFLLGWSLLSALLCVVNLHWYVFWHLVVLVKLSVLVKWLARRTPLRKSICADGIVFPGRRVFMNFMIVSFHYLIIWCVGLVPRPYVIYFILLSLHFTGHFPGGPWLAGTRMFPFWILLEQRMMEVLMTTGAVRCAKLQSNHHQQPTFDKLHVLPVAQPTVSKHWREIPASCYLYLQLTH